MDANEVVAAYFAAMRRGADAGTDLFDLFTDDAVYSEPFSGEGPAEGIEAIRRRFADQWTVPLPELELDVLEMTIAGSIASARWECRSPGLPGPVRGEDRYELVDGRIARLDVTITERLGSPDDA